LSLKATTLSSLEPDRQPPEAPTDSALGKADAREPLTLPSPAGAAWPRLLSAAPAAFQRAHYSTLSRAARAATRASVNIQVS